MGTSPPWLQVDKVSAAGGAGDGSGGAGSASHAGSEAGAADRALRQMMGGTLAAREDDTNVGTCHPV